MTNGKETLAMITNLSKNIAADRLILEPLVRTRPKRAAEVYKILGMLVTLANNVQFANDVPTNQKADVAKEQLLMNIHRTRIKKLCAQNNVVLDED